MPILKGIISKGQGRDHPILVEGAMDLAATLMKDSQQTGIAAIHTELSQPIIHLICSHDDPGLLQSSCEYLRSPCSSATPSAKVTQRSYEGTRLSHTDSSRMTKKHRCWLQGRMHMKRLRFENLVAENLCKGVASGKGKAHNLKCNEQIASLHAWQEESTSWRRNGSTEGQKSS